MTALVAERLRGLATTLTDLKTRVRVAIASELGRAVGAAVHDVLVVLLTERLDGPLRPSHPEWRSADEADRWGDPHAPRDPWDDGADGGERYPSSRSPDEPAAVPAVAVGVQVGRWWLSRRGGLLAAIGASLLAVTVGLIGGPVARAGLAVVAATADVLTANSALDPIPHDLP